MEGIRTGSAKVSAKLADAVYKVRARRIKLLNGINIVLREISEITDFCENIRKDSWLCISNVHFRLWLTTFVLSL